MKFKKLGDRYVVRVDRGEELVSALGDFCRSSGLKAGVISGIGATDSAVVGLFDVETKEFQKDELTGPHEMTSVLGTITKKDGEPYIHLHVNLADASHRTFGGHLVSAKISATFEDVVTGLPEEVGRFSDKETGLNLFEL